MKGGVAMLVREYMTPNPIGVSEDKSILETAELMKKHKVRRFPVLRDDRLIGIVTDRDLRSAAPSQVVSFDSQERELMPELHSLLSGITVKEVMSREVITIQPEQTIVAAAQLMLKHRMSGIPVTDAAGQLLGILTETDIFKVLVDLSGVSSGRTTYAFQLEDRAGSIKEVTDVVRRHGGLVASILTSHTLADPGWRRVYIRVGELSSEKLPALEKDLRSQADLLYVIEDDGAASAPSATGS
jgi:acetoin utilization protein AcuB